MPMYSIYWLWLLHILWVGRDRKRARVDEALLKTFLGPLAVEAVENDARGSTPLCLFCRWPNNEKDKFPLCTKVLQRTIPFVISFQVKKPVRKTVVKRNTNGQACPRLAHTLCLPDELSIENTHLAT